MTIARGAPAALFRLIFPVDISVSSRARKRERPLGVGMSVVTASRTGKSINEGQKGGRERVNRRGKEEGNATSTMLSVLYDRCFTIEFNGCPI